MPCFNVIEPSTKVPRLTSMRYLLNPSPYTLQHEQTFREFGVAAFRAGHTFKRVTKATDKDAHVKCGHVVSNLFALDKLHLVYTGQACTHPQCIHYIKHYTRMLQYATYKADVDALKHALHHAFMYIDVCYEKKTAQAVHNLFPHATCPDCPALDHAHNPISIARSVYESVLKPASPGSAVRKHEGAHAAQPCI